MVWRSPATVGKSNNFPNENASSPSRRAAHGFRISGEPHLLMTCHPSEKAVSSRPMPAIAYYLPFPQGAARTL